MGPQETLGEGQLSVSHRLRLAPILGLSSLPSVRRRHTVLKKNLVPCKPSLCLFTLERMETSSTAPRALRVPSDAHLCPLWISVRAGKPPERLKELLGLFGLG